ncbi:MAG: hypothetical protein QJR09_03285 [Micrococcus sp.]|nr:hypothetical protein [Micrococcus sp.]
MDDPQALADAETYLIHVLETSDPPRDADLYHITQAAQDYHSSTGTWDLHSAEPEEVEELLARHAK